MINLDQSILTFWFLNLAFLVSPVLKRHPLDHGYCASIRPDFSLFGRLLCGFQEASESAAVWKRVWQHLHRSCRRSQCGQEGIGLSSKLLWVGIWYREDGSSFAKEQAWESNQLRICWIVGQEKFHYSRETTSIPLPLALFIRAEHSSDGSNYDALAKSGRHLHSA